jgi:hypothetical protein
VEQCRFYFSPDDGQLFAIGVVLWCFRGLFEELERMKTLSSVLALVLLIALPASAQYAAVIHSCSRDVTTVCEGSQSGQNRFDECVKQHFPDLSESCKASLARIATVLKACAPDVQEQCQSIKPGAGRVFLCVKQHFSALSAPCKEAIGKAAERK